MYVGASMSCQMAGSLEAHPKHPPVLTGALAVLLSALSSRITAPC